MSWNFISQSLVNTIKYETDSFSISENEKNIIIKIKPITGQNTFAYISIDGSSKIKYKTIDNELQDYTCDNSNIYYITDINDKLDKSKNICQNSQKTSNIQKISEGGNYLEFLPPACRWKYIITDSSGNNIFLIGSDNNNNYLWQYNKDKKSYSQVQDQSKAYILYNSMYKMIYKAVLYNIICFAVTLNLTETQLFIIQPPDSDNLYSYNTRTFPKNNVLSSISCFYNNKEKAIHYIYINTDNECYIFDGTTDTSVNIMDVLGDNFKYSTCAANKNGSFLLVTVTNKETKSDSIFYSTDGSNWKILNTTQQFSDIKQIAYVNNSIYVLDNALDNKRFHKGNLPILSIYGITLTNNTLNITYENSVPSVPAPS